MTVKSSFWVAFFPKNVQKLPNQYFIGLQQLYNLRTNPWGYDFLAHMGYSRRVAEV